MTASAVRDWLARDLRPAARRIEARRLDALAIRLTNEGLDLESCRPGESIGYLAEIVREEIAGLDELRRRYVEFAASFGRAMDETEREDLILEFAQSLGASGADLHEDRRALRRWFGYEAVVERFSRREQYAEQTIGFFVERVGSITSAMMRSQSPDAAEALFRETGIEAIATPLLGHSGDERVRIEAFRALTRCLTALPPEVAETAVSARLIQFIYRAALDPGQNIWIQSEALALLLHSSPETFARAIRLRLTEPAEGDDLFVRGRAVRLLGGALKAHPELEDCLRVALADPSPHVRQEIPGSIVRSWPEKAVGVLVTILRGDPTASVRASALLAVPLLFDASDDEDGGAPSLADAMDLLTTALDGEQDVYVLRVALHVADEVQKVLVDRDRGSDAEAWSLGLFESLETLHLEAPSLLVRRAAALTRERLWSRGAEDRRRTLELLERLRDQTRPERRVRVSLGSLPVDPGPTLGRLLAVAAENDFGLFVERLRGKLRITRGHRFAFRLWRFLYELRLPATDKRQAHRHTIGRVFRGTLHAPSAILCELSQTKVPGEPLVFEEENGWRPYLPLVDAVISCLDEGLLSPKALEIYSAEGITTLLPPASLLDRLRARVQLVLEFSRYADLRNWQSGRGQAPNSFVEALRELGIQVSFRPHADDPGEGTLSADPSVTRFFEDSAP